MKSILILSSADTQYTKEANELFVEGIQERLQSSITLRVAHYDDIALSIEGEDISAWLVEDGADISSFNIVYFKSFYRYSEQAKAIAEFCASKGIAYICHELDDGISFSKLTQYTRMARSGLPVIPTFYATRRNWGGISDKVVGKFGFPFIFKATSAKGGDDNFLIKSKDHWNEVLNEVNSNDFLAQKFVPNDFDLRVLVAGDKVELVIKRQRVDESTHLNNTSKGASASLIPIEMLSDEVKELSLRAARIFKRDIAGVDIMFDKTLGKAWVLEVNASPQVATGAFASEKLDVYAQLFKDILLT